MRVGRCVCVCVCVCAWFSYRTVYLSYVWYSVTWHCLCTHAYLFSLLDLTDWQNLYKAMKILYVTTPGGTSGNQGVQMFAVTLQYNVLSARAQSVHRCRTSHRNKRRDTGFELAILGMPLRIRRNLRPIMVLSWTWIILVEHLPAPGILLPGKSNPDRPIHRVQLQVWRRLVPRQGPVVCFIIGFVYALLVLRPFN